MVALTCLFLLIVVAGAIICFERAKERRAWRTGHGYRDVDGTWIGPIPPRPNVHPHSQEESE